MLRIKRFARDKTISIDIASPDDFSKMTHLVQTWWGGRFPSDVAAPWFLAHFYHTCLVARRGGKLCGLIIGFVSPAHPEQACIKLAMVVPAPWADETGKALYQAFFNLAAEHGCNEVVAMTNPGNRHAIRFHRELGFSIQKRPKQESQYSAFERSKKVHLERGLFMAAEA